MLSVLVSSHIYSVHFTKRVPMYKPLPSDFTPKIYRSDHKKGNRLEYHGTLRN